MRFCNCSIKYYQKLRLKNIFIKKNFPNQNYVQKRKANGNNEDKFIKKSLPKLKFVHKCKSYNSYNEDFSNLPSYYVYYYCLLLRCTSSHESSAWKRQARVDASDAEKGLHIRNEDAI